MGDVEEIAAFVAKWRGAWPEWSLADVFVPAAQRPRVDAWRAVQFEWQEAAWGGTDARPGEAKLAWWSEELDGWANGRRRHPLGALLQRQEAPWRAIATALPTLAAARGRPADAADAWRSIEPVCGAIADVEAALMAARGDARAVAACWLHARLARHPDQAMPLDSGDAGNARAAWTRTLLAAWPASHGVSPSRGIALEIARRRLAQGDAAAALSPWSALWAGWRGARR